MNLRVLMVQLFSDMLGNATLHPIKQKLKCVNQDEQTNGMNGRATTNIAKMRTTTRRRKHIQMGACAAYL